MPRNLVMLNYEADPALLQPFVPRGTEIDQWQGKTFVSVVGFLFQNTRLRGIPIPFHSTFEEVNLRFYVRRQTDSECRRAVVFIKELVPRRAIAWTARAFYNENYIAVPMNHQWQTDADGTLQTVTYGWIFAGDASRLSFTLQGEAEEIKENSEEEFITEHYWGYAAQRDGGTIEYQVEHPRWRIWSALTAQLECNVEKLYGEKFSFLRHTPSSAFLADGSLVNVHPGKRLSLK